MRLQRDDDRRREWDRFRHEYQNPPELPFLPPHQFACPANCTYPGCENAEPAPVPIKRPVSAAKLAAIAKARQALAAKRAQAGLDA